MENENIIDAEVVETPVENTEVTMETPIEEVASEIAPEEVASETSVEETA